MFAPFERMVAMRYLRPRRQEGFVSVIAGFSLLGIALGVATLIIVMSVMNGFRDELLSRVLGLNGHIAVVNPDRRIVDFDSVADDVRRAPGVATVMPQIEGQVMATSRGAASTGALVRGIRPDDLRRHALLSNNIVSGTLDDFGGRDTVLLGNKLALRLGLQPGDRISLISPRGSATAFGTVPRMGAFRVVATFGVGMFEYDNSFIYMPLEAAQLFFNLPDAVSKLEVMVDDPERVKAIGRGILERGREGVFVIDWQQQNSSFFNALEVERNVMFLILTLIVLVAALNIISGLIMLVKDKGRDIAILRTMGATRGSVMRIFLMSGATVGIVGTLAGLVLGLVFTDNIDTIKGWLQNLTGTTVWDPEIRFLSTIPAIVDPYEVAQVVLMALGLSFLATIYPSWRAARLDPVEALRYE